jgi:hypothetical protein
VFELNIAGVDRDFQKAKADLQGRAARAAVWEEKLGRCFSEFEAMCRDIQKQLLFLLATPKRREELKELSFQQLVKADEKLKKWLGIGIIPQLPAEDIAFINRMQNLRHLFTHNNGCVDQEYLDNTGDKSVKLYQKVSVQSKEIARLIPSVN